MINWVKKKIIIFIVIKVTEVSGWHANTHTKRQIIAEKKGTRIVKGFLG